MNQKAARNLLQGLYRAAIEGVEPSALVSRALARPPIDRALRDARTVGVFAVGKAAAAMLREARGRVERGLAVLPRGSSAPGAPGVAVIRSSHPEPDRASLAAARRALAFFASFGEGDLVLCLVSGGTSAMLSLPRRGVTLEAKRRAVKRLATTGASILEINRLRTSLSAVKGGGLGRATRARLVTLVLSDVAGDRPAVVGSGPTIRGREGDLVAVVGSNARGLAAAAAHGRGQGLRTRVERASLSGEARLEGAAFAKRAKSLRPGEALLAGGETTVRLSSSRGRGGRNLEFALGAALEIDGEEGLTILAAGSDGRDGSSSAAGAFAEGSTIPRARRLGLHPRKALMQHASDAFFRRLGGLLVTGPTGTNVADWVFAMRA